jgi:hypothetical protein
MTENPPSARLDLLGFPLCADVIELSALQHNLSLLGTHMDSVCPF